MNKITCFGEVLWDNFPTYKKAGGASLNVALRLHSLKNDVKLISSLGNDPDGKDLNNYIKSKGLSLDYIQHNSEHSTSTVEVVLDHKGLASYTIKKPCAWDYIVLTNELISIVKNSKAFLFGSLIARSKTSSNTLLKLLPFSRLSVFDINLRPPNYNMITIKALMSAADFIKFNDDELIEISTSFGLQDKTLEQTILFVASKTNTTSICVTLGSQGAILYFGQKFYHNTGYPVDVVDTVGAGDSFLATLIDALLKNSDPQMALDRACAVGALVAQNQGANPKIYNTDIDSMLLKSNQ